MIKERERERKKRKVMDLTNIMEMSYFNNFNNNFKMKII